MPQYRGLLLNEWVAIWRRTMTDDGMCGAFPNFGVAPVVARYRCRVYVAQEEHTRRDTGEEREDAWTMVGNPVTGTGAAVDIREGDKIVRSNGQAFFVTSLRLPLDGRVKHHLRAVLRRVEGAGTEAI